MIRFLILLLFVVLLQANDKLDIKDTITQLQKEFIDNIIMLNAYKLRYNIYLKNNCGDIDMNTNCVKKKILYIKSWGHIKKDKALNTLTKLRLKQLGLDYEGFYKYNQLQLDKQYWDKILKKLNHFKLRLHKSQFIVLIDLEKQFFLIVFYNIVNNNWIFIGVDLISSGDMEREVEVKKGEDHYFRSPAGIFYIKNGWRSDGKINTDGSFGYGAKDRFVFYIGKVISIRYNTFDKKGAKIKNKKKWKLVKDKLSYALHAHKSNTIFGKKYSHGCFRMSNELNIFLDNNLILHNNNFLLNKKDQYKWLLKWSSLPKKINKSLLPYMGEYVLIFNSI